MLLPLIDTLWILQFRCAFGKKWALGLPILLSWSSFNIVLCLDGTCEKIAWLSCEWCKFFWIPSAFTLPTGKVSNHLFDRGSLSLAVNYVSKASHKRPGTEIAFFFLFFYNSSIYLVYFKNIKRQKPKMAVIFWRKTKTKLNSQFCSKCHCQWHLYLKWEHWSDYFILIQYGQEFYFYY